YHPKCKITLGGDAMKIERDERKFDFHEIGLAIKKAREREGLTQAAGMLPLPNLQGFANTSNDFLLLLKGVLVLCCAFLEKKQS
ncbi:MAG: hypothetical protein IJ982_03880, partial [Fibrobacter sp.]|nr:hypothetical protein [Fibrobacter sp.]